MKTNRTLKVLRAILLSSGAALLTASSAAPVTAGKPAPPRISEPERVIHALKKSFEFHPNTQETATADREPGSERGFDAQTGQAGPNPIFGFRW